MKLSRRWPDWPRTTTGFRCETLHQFWCESFTVIACLTTYDYSLLLRNFTPVLVYVWNFHGDGLTDHVRLLAFAAKLCTSSGVKVLRWLPDGLPTTTGFWCETLHQFWCTCETVTVIAWLTTYDYWLLLRNFAPVLVYMWNCYGDCLSDHVRLLAFAAKLCTSSGVDVKLFRRLPDWPRTITGFGWEFLHQFWCETFMAIAWLTTYDYWLLLGNFAPVLVKLLRRLPDCLPTTIGFCCETLHQFCVWIFYGYCLTDYLRLLALAAKFYTSSGVKLLRWLPDWLSKATGFCCETLHQFWCEFFTVIASLSTYDYWLLLRNFAPALVKLLRRLPDWLPTTTGFSCEILHQLWCETFTVIAWLTTYAYWLLLRNFAPVLVWNFYGDCVTDHVSLLAFAAKLCTSCSVKLLRWLPDWLSKATGFCFETLHQFWCETFTMIAWLTTYDYWLLLRIFCTSSGLKLLRWLPDWLPTTTGFCCETFHQFWCESFTVISSVTAYHYWLLLRNVAPVLVWNFYDDSLTDLVRLLGFSAKLCTSSSVKLLRWFPDWLLTTIMASWLGKKWVSKIKLRLTSSS